MGIRVLFIGENWHGSNATSCLRAFRAAGCDVMSIDERHFFPQWITLKMRAIRRLIRPLIVSDFASNLKVQAEQFRPHLVFMFKGVYVRKSELIYLSSLGAKNFIFYPDVNLESHYQQSGNDFWSCAREYDVFFTPKSYQMETLKKNGVKKVEFLPYAFDPWCHYPVSLSSDEEEKYGSDVTFVGTWGKERAETLHKLVEKNFPYSLAVWGNQWERVNTSSPLREYIKFSPAYGETQAKIFKGSKIALAFLSPPDLHTARTFEIPAYGAFMLAESSSEHKEFFEEDHEIVCFSDVEELRQKIDYYLENDQERKKIALAGFQKVTRGGHSYLDRINRVLNIYDSISKS
jgi:spore maturation protein CgeB